MTYYASSSSVDRMEINPLVKNIYPPGAANAFVPSVSITKKVQGRSGLSVWLAMCLPI